MAINTSHAAAVRTYVRKGITASLIQRKAPISRRTCPSFGNPADLVKRSGGFASPSHLGFAFFGKEPFRDLNSESVLRGYYTETGKERTTSKVLLYSCQNMSRFS